MRKSLLLCLLSLVLLPPVSAGQEPNPQSAEARLALDHIKSSSCVVASSKDFSTYGLYFHVVYLDKPPFDLFVEGDTPDYESLYDQCQAFLLEVQVAQIKEAVQNGKEEMKRKRDAHFFLDAKKLAKK